MTFLNSWFNFFPFTSLTGKKMGFFIYVVNINQRTEQFVNLHLCSLSIFFCFMFNVLKIVERKKLKNLFSKKYIADFLQKLLKFKTALLYKSYR